MPSIAHQNRWWWLAVSYLTNKAFLIALAIVSLVTAFNTVALIQQKQPYVPNYPDPPRGRLRVTSLDSLAEMRRSGRQADVDEIDLSSLWYSLSRAEKLEGTAQPPESFYDVLSEFPNLKIVRVQFYDAQTGVAKVAQVKSLKYLQIFSVHFRDLSALESLTNLERLDLNIFKPLAGMEKLTTLPRLATILIGSEDALSLAVLDELAQMPHLSTLVLAFSGTNDLKMQPTLNSLAKLAKSPILKTLYVGGHTKHYGVDLIQEATRAMPRVTVWPALVRRQTPLPMILMPVFALGLSVGAMLGYQLRCSTSGVIPNFTRRNVQVAAAWMLLASALQIALLVMAGFALAAVPITVAIGAFAMAASFHGTLQQQSQTSPGTFAQFGAVLLGLALAAAVVLPVSVMYLRAGNPLLLAGLTLSPLLSLVMGVRAARLLVSTEPKTPLPRGRVMEPVAFRPGWSFATEAREQQIEAWPRGREYWNWWNRIQRWRAGNPPFRNLSFGVVAGVWAIFAAGFPAIINPQQAPQVFRSQMFLMPVIMMGIVSLRVAQSWLARIGSLGTESLRPCWRKNLQQEWALALVFDLLPGIAALALLQAITANLSFDPYSESLLTSGTVDWAQVPLDFVLVMLGAGPMSVAVAALLTLIQRPWLKILVIFVMIATVGSVTGLLIGLTVENPGVRPINPRVVLVNLWLPAVLGSVISVLLYCKWRRTELERPA